jgi:hypothetical protein
MANTPKAPSPKIYYIKIKQKKKQNVIARRAPMTMTTTGSQRLIPGAMARVIVLLHVLWDPRDRGHTKIL